MEAVKNYEVKLEIFEGPLDLLVYLAQKNELRPEDIPISIITDQYLEYIEQIGVHNLSQAGEFLVMASRLMWLKAREMLPKDQLDEIDEMEFDLDKEALLQQMREHQTFKEASNYLRHLEVRNFGSFSRGKREKLPSEERDPSQEEDLFEAGIFELLSAFSSAMKHRKNTVVHQVEIDDVTIERQIKKFQNMLNERKYFHFEEFFEDDARKIVIVVSFMALLEICKISTAYIQQHALFGPIWVYSRKHLETAAKMPAEPPDMRFTVEETFNPDLVKYIQESILKKNEEQALEKILGELDYLKESGMERDEDDEDEEDNAGRGVEGAENELTSAAQEIMS